MEWTSVALEEREQEARWAHRRTQLKQHYETLPLDEQAGNQQEYLFWQRVEAVETPLEVLVRCVRACASPSQTSKQRRLIEVIIRRTQYENETWARGVLSHLALHEDERRMLNADLCADLYEAIVRALLDPERRFWEEHFHHCLRYERQHIFRAFMMREGRWRDRDVERGSRIPRAVLQSLERPVLLDNGEEAQIEVEDARAEHMLRSVETSALLSLVQMLPRHLRMILLLLFWQEQTEREVACTLGITDRTVRNRKRQALEQLRLLLQQEEEVLKDGA
ncbi:hypothetical protein KSC_037480 [Ktedonobacter sp. SOSP1-52]|uniref:RNA polymerase sigma factor n=1 Tax=Ktedonobacter sp. SOSP1-52 TaxID=2778366 RepID=UPI001916C8F9|nr:sigma-70 family RNA polymerase sigma factor [Ktedonobacter sp. SOSP1-52]GHO64856.1 hypothetical protein KSC_037480 [Ktedonobacter sp. SOSP1-52]